MIINQPRVDSTELSTEIAAAMVTYYASRTFSLELLPELKKTGALTNKKAYEITKEKTQELNSFEFYRKLRIKIEINSASQDKTTSAYITELGKHNPRFQEYFKKGFDELTPSNAKTNVSQVAFYLFFNKIYKAFSQLDKIGHSIYNSICEDLKTKYKEDKDEFLQKKYTLDLYNTYQTQLSQANDKGNLEEVLNDLRLACRKAVYPILIGADLLKDLNEYQSKKVESRIESLVILGALTAADLYYLAIEKDDGRLASMALKMKLSDQSYSDVTKIYNFEELLKNKPLEYFQLSLKFSGYFQEHLTLLISRISSPESLEDAYMPLINLISYYKSEIKKAELEINEVELKIKNAQSEVKKAELKIKNAELKVKEKEVEEIKTAVQNRYLKLTGHELDSSVIASRKRSRSITS